MNKVLLLVFLIVAAAAQGKSTGSQQSIGTIQQKSGNCSINVAGVQGNVTVHAECGLAPEVSKRLDGRLAQLLKQGKVESALRAEAESWKNRYLELEDRLANADIGVALSHQAKDLLEKGDFEKVREILERAIASGENDVDRVAEDHFQLAQVYWLEFQPQKALENQALAYQYRPRVPAYGINYEAALFAQNHLPDAERIGVQVLASVRSLDKTDPRRSHALILILNNLGTLYKNTARPTEAEDAFSEALAIAKSQPSADLANQNALAMALNGLAAVHLQENRFEAANSEMAEEITTIENLNRQTNNSNELNLAGALANVGELRLVTLDYKGAKQALERALEIETRRGVAGGMGSPETLGNLSILYQQTCDSDRALWVGMGVIAIFQEWARQNPEAGEPKLAISLKNQGVLYAEDGKAAQADEAFSAELAIYARLAEKDPKNYSWRKTAAIGNLAWAKLLEGKFTDSEKLSGRALSEWRQQKEDAGSSAPATKLQAFDLAIAEEMATLARVYAQTGRIPEARTTYSESMTILSRYRVSDINSGRLAGRATLSAANFYRSTADAEQAAPLFLEASKIYEKLASATPDCHGMYTSSFAESTADLARAEMELRNLPAAREAALHSIRAYHRLRSLDRAFTVEEYASTVPALLETLKKAGAEPSTICPLAAEVVQDLGSASSKNVADFVANTCK